MFIDDKITSLLLFRLSQKKKMQLLDFELLIMLSQKKITNLIIGRVGQQKKKTL